MTTSTGEGDVARAFHAATKHTFQSIRTGGRALDWDNKPHPFKVYADDLPRVPLLADLPTSDVSLLDALGVGAGDAQLDLPGLARLLVYGAGVLRKQEYGGETYFFRTYASAGALYPVEIYVVAGELEGVGAGVYHLDPLEKSLQRLRDGDVRGAVVGACASEPAVEGAAAHLVLTGIPWRTGWKYGERGYRHLWWDAGTILANLLALSASAGVSARVVVGFDDGDVARLIGVDGVREFPLCVVPLGRADGVSPAEVPEALDLAVEPLSAREERFPGAEEVHAAGRLTREQVAHWREEEDGGTDVPPSSSVAGARTVEQVIRRRGSARRFAPAPIPAAHLTTILGHAASGVPTDYAPSGSRGIRLYPAVHSVEGMEPGAYVWEEGELQLLRRGDVRQDAAYLCLEQRLGGQGAATMFLMSDVEGMLGRYGDRGYRAAQLEGGMTLGRLDLAAHALGWGATGLTFYDDDVTAYFSPHAAGLACMVVCAVGERRGRLLPLA